MSGTPLGGRFYGKMYKAGNSNWIQSKIHDLKIGPINDRGQFFVYKF